MRAGPKKVFLMIRNLFSGGGDIVAQVERDERKGKAAVAARSQIMPPFVATAKIPTKKKERKNERAA